MEKKLARYFNEKVNESILNEELRQIVYSTLDKFQSGNGDVKKLVTELKTILADPDYMPLFDHLRPLIPTKQQLEYDWLQPSRGGERTRIVTLHRSNLHDNLGFAVRGGKEFGIGMYVTCVKPGSAAHQQDLRVGDQIHRINGFILKEAVNHEIANLVKGKQFLEMSVRNVGMIPHQLSSEKDITWIYVEETLSERSLLLDGRYYTTVNICMVLPINATLGCSIVSRDNGAIHVQTVKGGGIAEQAGLEEMDQLLQVNGTLFSNITHSQAVVEMKSSRLLNMTILKRLSSKLLLNIISPFELKNKLMKGKARHESDIKGNRPQRKISQGQTKGQTNMNNLNKVTPHDESIKSEEQEETSVRRGEAEDKGIDNEPIFMPVTHDDVICLNPTNHNTDNNATTSGSETIQMQMSISTVSAATDDVFSASVVVANSDLAGYDQIYEEPTKLIEQMKNGHEPSHVVMIVPQDNLRELRKKIDVRKPSVAKVAKSSLSRADSIEELDEDEAAVGRTDVTAEAAGRGDVSAQTADTCAPSPPASVTDDHSVVYSKPVKRISPQESETIHRADQTLVSPSHKAIDINTIGNVIYSSRKSGSFTLNDTGVATSGGNHGDGGEGSVERRISITSERRREFERKISSTSQLPVSHPLRIDATHDNDVITQQQTSPKGVVYPHTSDKNPSFRIQKPVLLHCTTVRKASDTQSPSSSELMHQQPARVLRSKGA